MKYRKIILTSIAAMLLMSLIGCSISDQGSIHRIHRYINKSGVEIAMVGKAFGADIPDSLVIPNGKTFECGLRYPGMSEGEYEIFPYDFGNSYNEAEYIPIKVYYDKKICVSYTYKDKGKNPMMLEEGSYVKERTEKKNLITVIYTYTFTAEDYQKVLQEQK